MFNWHKTLLPVVGLSLVTIGSCIIPSQAQALIKFSKEYNFSTSSTPILEKNLLVGPGEGVTTGADFSLNLFKSLVYANLTDASLSVQTGVPFVYDSNPQTFGQNEAEMGITFFGEDNDKLFGTLKGTNTVDPATFNTITSGKIGITGGEGRFKGASGSGTVLGNFSLDLTKPVNTGKVLVNLSFDAPKSIPENTNSVGTAFAALCAGVMLKKAYRVQQIVK